MSISISVLSSTTCVVLIIKKTNMWGNRMKKLLGLLLLLGLTINTSIVIADSDDSDKACPVGLFAKDADGNLMNIDTEFGAGIQAKTQCLENRKKIKLVMQVNKACRDTTIVNGALENHARSCGETRGYGIAQMKNMIRDYTVTHGIAADKLDLNIIVHGGGGTMLLDMPWNKLKPAISALLEQGVKVYFCQNTVRGMAKKMGLTIPVFVSKVLPGVEYVTAGLTAVADFQKEGYMYIQP